MRRLRALCISVAAFCATLPAQSNVKPLLTQPSEKLTFTQGFRDWGLPAIAGNTILSGRPNGPGGLYALDAATGKVKWIYRPAKPIDATTASVPLIVGDRVISAFGNAQYGAIIAVSLATGKEIWRVPAVPQFRYQAFEGTIIAYGKDKEGVIRALDIATGQERWQVKYENVGSVAPTVRDGIIYVTANILSADARFADLFLLALDAKTGREHWRYRLEQGANRLIVTADAVYLTATNYLYGVNRQTGKELWKVRQLYRTKKDSHGYDKDYLYNFDNLIEVGSQVVGVSEEALIGFDRTTGQNSWEFPGYFRQTWMSCAGSVLYFQGNLKPIPREGGGIPAGDSSLNAMDIETRRILWSFLRTGTTNPDWRLDTVPFDGGLWSTAYGAIIKLQ
jgi:outer membrane protein assembly factor BamB